MADEENRRDMTDVLPEDAAETLFVDSGEAFSDRSAAEWRSRFGISEGEEISEYGELQTLGIGGMGAVFEAEDPALKRPVALKLLRPQYRDKEASIERFIREAQITAQIDHPNVVSVHRFGFFEGVGAYFTMKRVQGRTLKRVLEKVAEGDADFNAQYPLRHLIQIFISVCNCIAAAHERGYLHCDLKPANIMVGKFGEVFVMDWGIARKISPDAETKTPSPPSSPHLLDGTLVFMAPELVSGEADYPDPQTDLYSLGAILWCILTREKAPFDPEMERQKMLLQIASGDFPRPSRCAPKGTKVPAELEAIVLKAMCRDRKSRYAGVTELLADLYNYMDGYPVTAYSPNIFYRTVKLIRRRPLVPLTLLAALITAGVFWGTLRVIDHVDHHAMFLVAHSEFYRSAEGVVQISKRLQRWKNNEDHLPEKLQMKHKQTLLFALRNVSADLFDVFSMVSRFSPEEQRHFLLTNGCESLRRLLLLKLEYEPEEFSVSAIKRFQRLSPELYTLSRSLSPRLNHLIHLILNGHGVLRIECDPSWKCSILRKGDNPLAVDAGGTSVELPTGEYKVRFVRHNESAVTKNIRVPLGLSVLCTAPQNHKNARNTKGSVPHPGRQ